MVRPNQYVPDHRSWVKERVDGVETEPAATPDSSQLRLAEPPDAHLHSRQTLTAPIGAGRAAMCARRAHVRGAPRRLRLVPRLNRVPVTPRALSFASITVGPISPT
jgi:hypothetical protein